MRLALSLLAIAVAAKLCVLGRQGAPEELRRWLDPWALPAFLAEDVLVAGLFAAALLAARKAFAGRVPAARLEQAATVVYALLAGWMVLNVPVTAVMSSPVTFAFAHAAGGALSDSFARYLSVANLAPVVVLLALALVLPRLIRPPRRMVVPVVALALLAALAPAARARVATRGLHRNAVYAFAETALRRGRASDDPARLQVLPPPCPPHDGASGADLGELRGAARGRHVVWVVLESAGARALTLYGAEREALPHLAALARDAVVWEHAYAAYPESIKGLFSMLCGRAPPVDSEASDYGAGRLPCAPIAATLAAAGYRTGLFHSGRFEYLGMDAVVQGRGFDTLADAAIIPSRFRRSFGVDERSTVEHLLRWVDATPAGRPFFAAYLPIAGHHPYRAPGEAPRPFPERSDRDEHLNDLHIADEAFGRLRDGLRARGLDRDTLYLVLGDHGEAFREHPGNIAHAMFLYEENVRVPLFAALPGLLAGQRRAGQLTSLIDLPATTLDLLGLPGPAGAGRSALSPAPQVVRFFTEQATRLAGLRDGRWKVLWDRDGGSAQLFDLARDPAEQIDLAADHPELVRRYLPCLGAGG